MHDILYDIREEVLAAQSIDDAFQVFLAQFRQEVECINVYLCPLSREVRCERLSVSELKVLFVMQVQAWGEAGDPRATALLT